jgi:cell division protein FtsB
MRRLLPIMITVFLAASAVIFFFGDSGLLALRGLERYRARLAANVEIIESRNRELEAELASLRDNPEHTIVMARSLGLFRPGDEVVRLDGVPPRAALYAVGDLLKLRKTAENRSAIFKAAAVGLSLLLLVFALLSARASRRRMNGSQGG